MTSRLPLLGLFSVLLILPGVSWSASHIHHQLHVKLTPASGRLQVQDSITLPSHSTTWRFSLNAGLSIAGDNPDVLIHRITSERSDPTLKEYRIDLPPGHSVISIRYQGRLAVPADSPQGPQGNPGHVSADGVYLDGNSHWYPQFGDDLVTFSMAAELPPSWRGVSQGLGQRKTGDSHATIRWREDHPQQEIYLLAAAYHEYDRQAGRITAQVFLRNDDAALADRYLGAIANYVKMYDRLLGPYPYDKFAVVENTWESGFGMPSFTLLGPQVMRFPFILYTSLPHEILHDWWGNGVYVDYAQGNWSEGLTAYLADHLMREQMGQGVNYRRKSLQRYTNYVSAGNDFPLKDFQGRHSEATQAVGYDKALMVFHMLRLELGDKAFLRALRNFYREQKYHVAGWNDLRRAFEAVAGHSLQEEFDQWLNRRGAPALRLGQAESHRDGGHFLLTAEITQTQAGPAYRLHVPVAVQLDGRAQAWQTTVTLTKKRQTIRLKLPTRPWRLEVDPQFDVFRHLDRSELPPSLGETFGADSLLVVLPAAAPPTLHKVYARFARAWAEQDDGVEIRWDKDLSKLPDNRAVWLMGWRNRFLPQLAGDLSGQMSLSADNATLEGQTFPSKDRTVVLTTRHHGAALMWLGCDNPAAFSGLARKLPHYGSYSYLAFQGDAPTNVLKGQWPVTNSPLNTTVIQADHTHVPADVVVKLAPRTALVAGERRR